ncbi:MAG: ATP-binding protein [Polyangiaceae bacterium]
MRKHRPRLHREVHGRREPQKLIDVTVLSDDEVRRLVSELQIHQLELEIQNEQLQTARADIEAGLARYTELFDFAPIGYVALARDETIGAVNHVGSRILGVERRQLIGRRFANLIATKHRDEFGRLLGRAHDSEARETCELEVRGSRSQSIRTLQLSAAVLTHGVAEQTVLLAFEDVTARIEQEKSLASTEQALREADRRKDEFLAVLSHELRNPLAPIRNSLYVLSRSEPGSQRAQSAFAVIERQVSHLTKLVDDLLDVTRIAHGKIHLHCERFELREVVRSTIEDQRGTFEANGIRLDYQFDPGNLWLNADPARLVQILSNLLGNAQKFTPRGGSVTVSLHRACSNAILRVRDTGVGVPQDIAPLLFEPFRQATQTIDRSHGGLGLGLAMTKGLVELQGGRVALTSDGPGQGTTVTVSQPLDVTSESSIPPSATRTTCGRRVLVIEDNQDTADSLKDALVIDGHQVETAYDGPSGLERARQLHPEVIICDIGLPRMDGYEVAKAIRSDNGLRDTYLVALTGYGMPEDLERALSAGFDEHVTKPRSTEKLSQMISSAPTSPTAPPVIPEAVH